MCKASAMYPDSPGTRFDMDCYVKNRLKTARKLMGPDGLVKIAFDEGISDAGQPAPFHCIGQLYFEDLAGYDRSVEKHGVRLRGDFPTMPTSRRSACSARPFPSAPRRSCLPDAPPRPGRTRPERIPLTFLALESSCSMC